MKKASEISANYGPVYAAAIYPKLAAIFQGHGYALAVHGSVARDFDLIAVPWVESPSTPDVIFDDIESEFAITLDRSDVAFRNHGRIAWIMTFGFGDCAVDLSFFPGVLNQKAANKLHEDCS